jgi:hypothetical protein
MSHISREVHALGAPRTLTFITLLTLLAGTGCARARPLMAELAPMALAPHASEAQPPILTENHFTRDRSGGISEAGLREVLAAPVFIEEKARVGVVPVREAYALDVEVPLPGVPAALADALEASGAFELAFEISTDFPADRGISGLRELAARYRTDYLLIYRHRFVDRSYFNPFAWGYLTGVGTLFLPGSTLETAGVLEATLFDVKTGTLLFTVHERVHAEDRVNAWHHELKTQGLQRRLLETATRKLSEQVVSKVHRLVAARPAPEGASDPVLSSLPVTVSTHGN